MKKYRVSLTMIFLLMAGGISGCTALYDKNHGSKVELNKSAQVINADAIYEEDVPLATLEGQKAEKLMLRYRTEKADAPTEKLLKDIGD